MIAVLIIAHDPFATALMHCTRHVYKQLPLQFAALDVLPDEDPNQLLNGARLLGTRINDGSGLVVLTDLFGATPARIAAQMAEANRIIVFHGVNLPTLLKTLNYRRNMPLEDLAAKLEQAAPLTMGLCEPMFAGSPCLSADRAGSAPTEPVALACSIMATSCAASSKESVKSAGGAATPVAARAAALAKAVVTAKDNLPARVTAAAARVAAPRTAAAKLAVSKTTATAKTRTAAQLSAAKSALSAAKSATASRRSSQSPPRRVKATQ